MAVRLICGLLLAVTMASSAAVVKRQAFPPGFLGSFATMEELMEPGELGEGAPMPPPFGGLVNPMGTGQGGPGTSNPLLGEAPERSEFWNAGLPPAPSGHSIATGFQSFLSAFQSFLEAFGAWSSSSGTASQASTGTGATPAAGAGPPANALPPANAVPPANALPPANAVPPANALSATPDQAEPPGAPAAEAAQVPPVAQANPGQSSVMVASGQQFGGTAWNELKA